MNPRLPRPRPLQRALALAWCALALGSAWQPVQANPQGGVVVGGSATIAQPSPALTQVQQFSQNAVINWQSFSIGSGEAVRFTQPSPTASVLNRVVGNDPSRILGSLSANGRVYLVNQNGVFVGPDAQIDAAALVMSTADIRTDDFMAGRLDFTQAGRPGAKIVNEGRITARDGGLVALVAPGVENRGVISARLGQVVLGGAPAFSLDLLGDGMVNILLTPQGMQTITDASGKPLANYVDTTGRVTAEGGRIWIGAAQARGIVDSMVHIGGELRATRVAERGGEITLLGGDSLRVDGQILASSADGQGGHIAASAANIALGSSALLDASGANGGGSVLVGGNYQGKSPVPGADSTARTLDVARGARVQADATGTKGNGGQVVLWSDDATRFAGSVSARAGSAGGHGGLMEVSGKKQLAFEGTADASAPNGQAGTLLLDPGSLTVAASGSGSFTASGADSVVAAGTINSVLRTGTTVALRADDNITVDAQIDGRTLPGGPASASGGGLTLTAGGAVTVKAPIVLNDGALAVNSGSFAQADNNIIATLGDKPISITTTGDIASQYLLTSGTLSLTSTRGNITAGRPLGVRFEDGTALPLGGLSVSAALGTANLGSGLYVNGNATLGAGNLQLGDTIATGLLQVAGGSNFTLLGNAQVGGLRAGTDAAPLASFSMAGAADARGPQIDAGSQGVAVTANVVGALRGIRSAAGIGLDARGGDLTLARMESTGAGLVDVRSTGSIDLPANADIVSYGGTVALRAGTGHLETLGTIAVNSAAAPGAANAGNIVLSAGGDIGVRQLVGLGNTNISSSNGSVRLNQSLGGTNDKQPLLGSLFVSAGKDVITNGLNLAGAASGDGLRIEAGTTGGAGHIYVNDRVGVSSGDLRFGPARPVDDGSRSIVLRQGIYARTGKQDITFNVPVLADGSRILSDWQAILAAGQSEANLARIVDMVLLPGDGNTAAQGLLAAGGAYRVAYSDGKITGVCLSGAVCGPEYNYVMVPKIVISNQEVRSNVDDGVVRVGAGTGAVALDGYASAAIKFIVPMSADERRVELYTTSNTKYRKFENDYLNFTSSGEAVRITNLQMTPGLTLDFTTDNNNFVYENALPSVVEYIKSPRINMQDSDAVSVAVLLYPGAIGGSTIQDSAHTLPSGDIGFNSNSTPVGFVTPFSSSGPGLGLSAQILGALPPVSTAAAPPPSGLATAIDDSGNLLAATAAIESRAQRQDDLVCPGRDRLVIGRSAGDEVDLGATSALQGAPRPVFTTTYALGQVRGVPTADEAAIAGRPRASSCL